MREVILANREKGFSIVRPEVRRNKYAEQFGVLPANIGFTRSVYHSSKNQRIFYFRPKKLGECFLKFYEGEFERYDCRIYIRRDGIEISKLPNIHVTTSVVVKQAGRKNKRTASTSTYKCLRINGITMKIPDDFEDLLNELNQKGNYGLKVTAPIGQKLFSAGLLQRSNRGHAYGTDELRKNYKAILKALR